MNCTLTRRHATGQLAPEPGRAHCSVASATRRAPSTGPLKERSVRADEEQVRTKSSEVAARARIVGAVALVTALLDWALKAAARAIAPESLVLNQEPFSLGSTITTWVPLLPFAVLVLRLPNVNTMMLCAWGLAVGGGIANELESRLVGGVTDFIRPGLLGNAVYAPADLALYAAVPVALVGYAAWLVRVLSHR
jgi:hypothetical protein